MPYGLDSRGIIGMFYEELEIAAAASWVGGTSMFFGNSDQASETYKFLGASPGMREWIGGRLAKSLRANGFTIDNKTFEATLEVLVDEMRRDKTDQIRMRVGQLAEQATSHDAELLTALILAGASSLCYDGQYFFDTDHLEGDSGSQSNKVGVDISALPTANHGSVTSPAAEEMELVILKGVEEILGFKNDRGKLANPGGKEFIVMAPVSLMTPVLKATGAATFASGVTNTLATNGKFTVIPEINGELTWTDTIAIFRTDSKAKAFIRQEEEALSVAAIAEGTELEFNQDLHHYGIKRIGNAGYGFWNKAVQVTMT